MTWVSFFDKEMSNQPDSDNFVPNNIPNELPFADRSIPSFVNAGTNSRQNRVLAKQAETPVHPLGGQSFLVLLDDYRIPGNVASSVAVHPVDFPNTTVFVLSKYRQDD